MGFMVISIFLCIFLILAIYIYYKEKGEEFFTDNKGVLAKVRIDKGKTKKLRKLCKNQQNFLLFNIRIKWKVLSKLFSDTVYKFQLNS